MTPPPSGGTTATSRPAAGATVGAVAGLSRFPVKSTAGESLSAAPVSHRGLLHDREWAAYTADDGIASGKITRRFRRLDGLMSWLSRVPAGDRLPTLQSPDGDTYRVDDQAASEALTGAFGSRSGCDPRRTSATTTNAPCTWSPPPRFAGLSS